MFALAMTFFMPLQLALQEIFLYFTIMNFILKAFLCATCALTIVACDDDDSFTPTKVKSDAELSSDAAGSSDSEAASSDSKDAPNSSAVSSDSKDVSGSAAASSNLIKKIQLVDCEVSFYAFVLTLNKDVAAPEGSIHTYYYKHDNLTGTETQILDFEAHYTTESDGTYTFNTFMDGEIYQNKRQQTELKFIHPESGYIRADQVVVFYTPKGGEETEIFSTTFEEFCSQKN